MTTSLEVDKISNKNDDTTATMEIGMNHEKVIERGASVLDKHTDPFAERTGKTLVWKNVNMILVSSFLIMLKYIHHQSSQGYCIILSNFSVGSQK
jgi:hypothetical protein